MNLLELIVGTTVSTWIYQNFMSDKYKTDNLRDRKEKILDAWGGVDPRDFVPKCKWCNNYCMLPLPEHVSQEIADRMEVDAHVDRSNGEFIYPTCKGGKRSNKRRTGYDFEDAKLSSQQNLSLEWKMKREAKHKRNNP